MQVWKRLFPFSETKWLGRTKACIQTKTSVFNSNLNSFEGENMTFISLFVFAHLTASVLNWCFWSWEGKINSGCGEQPWFLICSLFAATSIFKSVSVQHHLAISLTESWFVMCNGTWQRSEWGHKTLHMTQYVNFHSAWHWKGVEINIITICECCH